MGTICGHLENYCQELTGSLDTDSAGLIITVPEIKEMINVQILAPIGAQEMLIFVCSFVRSFGSNLSRALNLHLSSSNLQAISQQSVSNL